jgi:uncharacterized protein (DUF1501 family)
MRRRDFLQFTFGSAMAAALAGPLLGCACGPGSGKPGGKDAGSGKATPPVTAGPRKRATSCILLYMNGGPSQIDTFDPKPGADTAGGVKAIGTAATGVQVSELLPLLAAQAKHLAVVRSIVSKEGNHARARHLMHTGYIPAGGVQHPSFGAITAAELGKGPLPGYVSINGPGADAGFLGAAYSPFTVGNPQAQVRNLQRSRRVDQASFDERLRLWRELEDGFAAGHDVAAVRDQRAVGEQAIAMMNAAQVAAFDLAAEPASVKQQYGDGKFPLGCLMARRLVEVGVPFVEVTLQGWDTHENNLERVKTLCAELDRGMAALIADLAARGLLETTLVVWAGDFGRTPVINERGGRDHYPQVTPAVFAGGGVRGGQVIGTTDARGMEVTDRKYSVPDLYASVAEALGIDPDEERFSPAGRPITTVNGGNPIRGLYG